MMSFGAGAEKLLMAEVNQIGGTQYVWRLPTRKNPQETDVGNATTAHIT